MADDKKKYVNPALSSEEDFIASFCRLVLRNKGSEDIIRWAGNLGKKDPEISDIVAKILAIGVTDIQLDSKADWVIRSDKDIVKSVKANENLYKMYQYLYKKAQRAVDNANMDAIEDLNAKLGSDEIEHDLEEEGIIDKPDMGDEEPVPEEEEPEARPEDEHQIARTKRELEHMSNEALVYDCCTDGEDEYLRSMGVIVEADTNWTNFIDNWNRYSPQQKENMHKAMLAFQESVKSDPKKAAKDFGTAVSKVDPEIGNKIDPADVPFLPNIYDSTKRDFLPQADIERAVKQKQSGKWTEPAKNAIADAAREKETPSFALAKGIVSGYKDPLVSTLKKKIGGLANTSLESRKRTIKESKIKYFLYSVDGKEYEFEYTVSSKDVGRGESVPTVVDLTPVDMPKSMFDEHFDEIMEAAEEHEASRKKIKESIDEEEEDTTEHFRGGDILNIRKHFSKKGEGLSYPSFVAIAMEDGFIGGWDVWDVRNKDTKEEVSVYGFSISKANGAIDRRADVHPYRESKEKIDDVDDIIATHSMINDGILKGDFVDMTDAGTDVNIDSMQGMLDEEAAGGNKLAILEQSKKKKMNTTDAKLAIPDHVLKFQENNMTMDEDEWAKNLIADDAEEDDSAKETTIPTFGEDEDEEEDRPLVSRFSDIPVLFKQFVKDEYPKDIKMSTVGVSAVDNESGSFAVIFNAPKDKAFAEKVAKKFQSFIGFDAEETEVVVYRSDVKGVKNFQVFFYGVSMPDHGSEYDEIHNPYKRINNFKAKQAQMSPNGKFYKSKNESVSKIKSTKDSFVDRMMRTCGDLFR